MLQVWFPAGCESVTCGLEEDELEERLKALSNTLRFWNTGHSDSYKEYEPLAYHLTKPFFLSHPNDTVQLLVASCLSDILRAFWPKSPYSQTPNTLVNVLLFLTKQLEHLHSPSSPSYDIYLYIFANVIRVDPFALCSKITDANARNRILQRLFAIFSEIMNKNQDEDIHRMVLNLIKSTLKSSQEVIEQFLAIIFRSFLHAPDADDNAENLSKKILTDSKKILWPIIAKNFIKILINPGNDDLAFGITSITLALFSIFSNIIDEILPQLKTFLKSQDNEKRSKAVIILSKLLLYERWDFASDPNCWRLFLKTFADKDETVRVTCIKQAKFFLLDNSKRADITDLLELLQYDRSLSVRTEVIVTILLSWPEKDFNPLADKDFETRRAILKRLTNSYNNSPENHEVSETPDVTQSTQNVIFNEILCGYYVKEEKVRIYVEKIVFTTFLRFRDEAAKRIRKLYGLFAQTDDNGSRAFAELQIHRFKFRKCLSKLFESKQKLKLETLKLRSVELEILTEKQLKFLSKFFEDPNEAEVSLQKFFEKIDEEPSLAKGMKSFLEPRVTCQESEKLVNDILAVSGDRDVTDPYYTTVKVLLERSSSILIDEQAVNILIDYIHGIVSNSGIQTIGLDSKTAVEKGLKLLEILSVVFAAYFTHSQIFSHLMNFLDIGDASIDIKVLNILRNIGTFGDLRLISSTSWTELVLKCKFFITKGTPKQAKAAIRLISGFAGYKAEEIFKDSLKTIAEELSTNPSSESRRTSIASLGYISFFFGGLKNEIHKLMKNVWTNILPPDPDEIGDNLENEYWCEKESLPKGTIHRLEAMKCIMRWLISSELHETETTEILRGLTYFISRNGDVNCRGKLRPHEKSWLRLQAGCCLLKLCRFERIGKELKPEQFYELSKLMLDDIDEVRRGFHEKLKRGLTSRCPGECLPIDFMGFYALGGLEKDRELRERLKRGMLMHIAKRRENGRKVMEGMERLEAGGMRVMKNIMPECGLMYAVVILAHWKGFSGSGGDDELRRIRRGLEFVMEHWFRRDNEERGKRFRFFEQLLKRLGACRDAQTPDDDLINSKIQTVCHVATCLLQNYVKKGEGRVGEGEEDVLEPDIPRRYLQLDEQLLREPENGLDQMETLAKRLKGLEEKGKEQQGVIGRMNFGPTINQIFGLNKRTKKRKTGESTVQESSAKRRRVSIQGN